MTILAITGGTGFIGRDLVRRARNAGHGVRALARRPQVQGDGIEWHDGTLAQLDRLTGMMERCGAVIHVAGVINAPGRADFIAGNIEGTRTMIEAARAVGVRRFIHVSSLAAREPGLSVYGWSKAQSEALVAESGLDWTIVRPPAVYGPGDRETLTLFRMAQRGLVVLPPGGRFSVIEVGDLARLLLALALNDIAIGRTVEPDDGVRGGWDHRDFAHALGAAAGRRVMPLPLPGWLVSAGAAIDTGVSRLRGRQPKLSFDRARYIRHPDWVASPEARPPVSLWRPEVATRLGLAATAEWYRREGWL